MFRSLAGWEQRLKTWCPGASWGTRLWLAEPTHGRGAPAETGTSSANPSVWTAAWRTRCSPRTEGRLPSAETHAFVHAKRRHALDVCLPRCSVIIAQNTYMWCRYNIYRTACMFYLRSTHLVFHEVFLAAKIALQFLKHGRHFLGHVLHSVLLPNSRSTWRHAYTVAWLRHFRPSTVMCFEKRQ